MAMHRIVRTNFLLITLAQGVHSIEEYMGKLWENFPPAKFISGLVSSDLKTGFIIIDISLFVLLMSIWFASRYFSTGAIMLFWSVMELINSIGHFVWSIMQASYEPGLLTAPVLFFLAIRMIILLFRKQNSPEVEGY
jgi:uncharacterized protein with HXXEE motif